MKIPSFWRNLPLLSFVLSEWQTSRAEQRKPCYSLAPMAQDASELPPYPIHMWPLMDLPHGPLDNAGVPYARATNKHPAGYYATTIAQYALTQWNAYLGTGDVEYRRSFMIQAEWLVANESHLAHDAGGWPFTFPLQDYFASVPWLSALTQGTAISVLLRAYRLTEKDVFLQVARRAIRTFEMDILDGGVRASIGNNGIFFEEVAVYPAAHILNGCIFALYGLLDYVALTADIHIASLIERSIITMNSLIDEFDMGYWSRYDLLHRHPAPPFYHTLHVIMFKALSRYPGCEHFEALAVRWTQYQHNPSCRLRYFFVSSFFRYRRGLQHMLGARGQATPNRLRMANPAHAITQPDSGNEAS